MITPRSLLSPRYRGRAVRRVALAGALAATSTFYAVLASNAASASSKSDVIVAVGAENEYANVLSQIGGKYVSVSSILNNPNTDPHTFEASVSVAEVVSKAELIVQNGVGYDGFMNTIEAASPNPKRKVIVVQDVARAAQRHAEPPPLVQPEDHAGRGQGDRGGPERARAEP